MAETTIATPEMKLIQQGAEGRVFETRLFGRDVVVKERFSKGYRHPTLDARLRATRTTAEVRCLIKCRQLGVDTPVLYHVDQANSTIYMERVPGGTVKAWLNDMDLLNADDEKRAFVVAADVANVISIIHQGNIVHGDLTTSNIMIREGKEGKESAETSGSAARRPYSCLTLIDFGLSYRSAMVEDKAVDLYVLEKAFLATHPNSEKMWERILSCYAAQDANVKVVEKLADVRRRGRKRAAFG